MFARSLVFDTLGSPRSVDLPLSNIEPGNPVSPVLVLEVFARREDFLSNFAFNDVCEVSGS